MEENLAKSSTPSVVNQIHAKNVAQEQFLEPSDLNFFASKRVEHFEDCIVLSKYSLLLNSDGKLATTALGEHVYWHPQAINMGLPKEALKNEIDKRLSFLQKEADLAIDKASQVDLPPSPYETIYCMHPFEWYPYGHIFDSLQRLYNVQSVAKGTRTVLINRNGLRVNDLASHFEMLGYSPNQLLSIPKGYSAIRVKKLVVPSSPAIYTQFTHDSIKWLRESYLQNPRFLDFAAEMDEVIKDEFAVYLDRSGSRRDLLNANEFKAALRSEIPLKWIYLKGNECLFWTIYALSRAKLVVGVHGAMFVNTIFTDSRSSIVEVCPSNRQVSNMVRMAKPCVNHILLIHEAEDDFRINLDINYVIARTRELMLSAG
jgi:hypothetical protein